MHTFVSTTRSGEFGGMNRMFFGSFSAGFNLDFQCVRQELLVQCHATSYVSNLAWTDSMVESGTGAVGATTIGIGSQFHSKR